MTEMRRLAGVLAHGDLTTHKVHTVLRWWGFLAAAGLFKPGTLRFLTNSRAFGVVMLLACAFQRSWTPVSA